MHRLLFWYIITSVLTRHRAFARTYFVDPSCPDRVSTVAIPEAITLASEAFTFSDAAFKKVIGRIFPAINDDQITLLYTDLSQIANLQRDTALSVTTNIIFYCDNDARWQVATDDQIPGNSARAADAKAWFDGANDLYHDLKKDGRDATTETRALPGCRAGDGTRAQTYVNRDTFAGPTLSRVGITICSSAYTDVTGALLPYLALQEIPEGTNLASRQNGVKPIIDTYRLVSVTVLHELIHQISRDTTGIKYTDVKGGESYGWKRITNMNLQEALDNADSLAYVGLAAHLIRNGYKISNNGDLSQI